MTNIFGSETVYVCFKCGSENVETQIIIHAPTNKPYEPVSMPPTFDELMHTGLVWCVDCEEEVLAINKEVIAIKKDL